MIKKMIKKMINKVFLSYYSLTPRLKVKFLIKLGMKIGHNSRVLTDIKRFSEPYMIEIGKNCLISTEVNFLTHDGGMLVLTNKKFFDTKVDKMGKIIIGDNVFIGNRVTIMPNVKIGDNVVIAAGAIVTKDFESDCVIGGVPAKKIMTLEEYYTKNKDKVHKTVGMNYKDKKLYYDKIGV